MPFFGGLNNYKIRGSNNYGGTSAAANLSTGVNNLLLGNQAGFSVIAGSQNVLLGTGAGSTEELSNVVGVGYGVVFGAAADGAVVVGNQANGGAASVVVGDRAGFGATGDPGSNVIIGDFAGFESLNTAVSCVLIGGLTYAGANAVVAVGRESYAGATGSIAIGAGATVDDTGGNGAVAIGNGTTSQQGVVIGPNLNNFAGLQSVAIGETLTLGTVGATVAIGANLDTATLAETGGVLLGDGGVNPLLYGPLGGLSLPQGTTGERSADAARSWVRWNTDLACVEFYDQIAAAWLPFNQVGTFSPTVQGMTSAGVGTYTIQEGTYCINGRKCNFTIRLGWSAHTGTGFIRIAGLPFAPAAGVYTAPSFYSSGLGMSGNLQALITPGSQTFDLMSNSNGINSNISMDTVVANLTITGCFAI